MPHVAPFFQGIHLTVTGHVKPSPSLSAAGVHAAFSSFYAGEKLIKVLPLNETPDVARHGSSHHGVTVGGFTVDKLSGRVACVATIDNLLKGAATQAIQNMNIALGLGEYDGIPLDKA